VETPLPAVPEAVEKLLRSVSAEGSAPGKGGDATLEGLRRTEAGWRRIRERAALHASGGTLEPPPQIVRRHAGEAPAEASEGPSVDVVVCGGTLGIFVAGALQRAGLQVCVIERGEVRGREQEWNLNPVELAPLAAEGVLTPEELEAAIVSRWSSSRVGIHGAPDFGAEALNAGVSPALLVAAARKRFEASGGLVVERAALKTVEVYDDAAILHLATTGDDAVSCIRTQLVVDAMGAASPIVSQARGGAPPDAACLVVGTMASGFPPASNTSGDYLYSMGPASPRGHQPFWESFPAASGGADGSDRTTYYFAYMLPGRTDLPDISDIFQEYVEALPQYQGVKMEDLTIRRALSASFVAYRDSPLATPFDRVMQVGDAAGVQSPLSFGGFAALCRHLSRVRGGIVEAVQAGLVQSEYLAALNPYLPNLSLQWTMYRAIALPPRSEPDFVNRVMGGILGAASDCGEEVSEPILQDVFSIKALLPTLLAWLSKDPTVLGPLVNSMGTENVFAALSHVASLISYTALSSTEPALTSWVEQLPAEERFLWRRRFEAWRYGSGLDFSPKQP